MLPLKDPSLLSDKCLVNGKWVGAQSGKTVDVTNPATGDDLPPTKSRTMM